MKFWLCFSKNYEKLIGLSKKDINSIFSESYNDYYSDIWVFRLNEKMSYFKKNYLYIYFTEDKVEKYELTVFRRKDVI